MKLVFAGTAGFAVPALEELHAHHAFEVCCVLSRPDQPVGRGRRMQASEVSQAAERLGLPLRRPVRVNTAEERTALAGMQPDLMVVAAYGQILRAPLLALPPLGCINVHASLLPRWRGAAPVAYALLAGDARTGITLMKMDEGLDTGPVLAMHEVAIRDEDDRGSLRDRLSRVGAELLPGVLLKYAAGDLAPLPQPESGVTYAPMLAKEEGRLDWTGGAREVLNRIRAFTPAPGAFTFAEKRRMLIRRASLLAAEDDLPPGPPGTVGPVCKGKGVPVRCGTGGLMLLQVQPEGKREMDAEAAARGRRLAAGMQLQAS